MADKIEEGRKLYEEIAEEDPKDFSARLRLSQIYRQQNQMDKAWAEHNKAKEIEPANLEIKYNEVNLYETQGKTAEAVNSLKELLTATQKRNYTPAEKQSRAVLLERMGLMYRNSDQHVKAIEVFKQLAELDPANGSRSAAQVMPL